MALERPNIFNNDPQRFIQEMKAEYELETGVTLSEASREMFIINMMAKHKSDILSSMESAVLQLLVPFSEAPFLDHICNLLGVKRLPPSVSQTTLEFTFVSGHGDFVLSAGTRVQSTDGRVIFSTINDTFIPSGTDTKEVAAWCETPGVIGNGYAIGTIKNMINPLPYVVEVTNINTTSGGAEMETDEQLRERFYVAPDRFSTAGPDDAYIYFARSASPAIIDVAVDSNVPGTVQIYPMVDGGDETPQEILDLVYATCNDEKVRPLTDTVTVISPTKIEFELEVNVTKISGALNSDIEENITNRLIPYLRAAQRKLGRNVTKSKLTSLCMYDDSQVYSVEFVIITDTDPDASELDIAKNEFAYCTSLTVTVVDDVNE